MPIGLPTFGVGVEKIIMRQILDSCQLPWTLERKYLDHFQQVFSTTKQAKASNAIALKSGQKTGLMLVVNGLFPTMYHVLQIITL